MQDGTMTYSTMTNEKQEEIKRVVSEFLRNNAAKTIGEVLIVKDPSRFAGVSFFDLDDLSTRAKCCLSSYFDPPLASPSLYRCEIDELLSLTIERFSKIRNLGLFCEAEVLVKLNYYIRGDNYEMLPEGLKNVIDLWRRYFH